MNCPVCKSAMRCKRSMPVGNKVIREYRCTSPTCTRKFMSEESFYHITDSKGRGLHSELSKAMYERYEKTPPALRKPVVKPPKKKKTVAPKPKRKQEGEAYLTYGEIFEKFKAWCFNNTDYSISDYRPYPLLDNSIIVWDREDVERVFQYDPDTDEFVVIEDAKTYEEILEGARRKRA